MNLYSPYYDPDENRTIMSIDENGSWVHIKTVEELVKQIALLRNALEQMDLQICAAGDLMTKEDMQEADRLTALRDSVLEQTKD